MAALRLGQQARHFSTSVIRSKLIRPPIQVYGVEGRYATALFSAASKQNLLDKVEQELGQVSTMIKDPKLGGIVLNPHVKRSLKQKVFNDALSKANVSPITVNLISRDSTRSLNHEAKLDALPKNTKFQVCLSGTLADNVLSDNGRLKLTADVITAFGKMMGAHRGEVICTVTTAQALDEASLADLKVALKGFLKKGETIVLETKSDPAILGGMIVSIGDKYVDMSTKTKITKLTKIIKDS